MLGEAGNEIVKAIKRGMKSQYNICGIIDDDINKEGYAISGIKILGNRNKIIKICEEHNIDVIFFCISKIDAKSRSSILEICQQTKAKIRILPGTLDIIKGKKLFDNLRNVEIEDLLRT